MTNRRLVESEPVQQRTMMVLMHTADFPEPVLPAIRTWGMSAKVGDDRLPVRPCPARGGMRTLVPSHSGDSNRSRVTLGLHRIRHLDADRGFSGTGAENVNPRSAFRAAVMLLERGDDLLQFHARGGMQFVSDGGLARDVTRRNLDSKLGERLDHGRRIRHQLLLRFGGTHRVIEGNEARSKDETGGFQ